MVAEGEADERGEVHFVVEVVVAAEVAGAGHDAFGGEGGAEEVGVEAVDVEADDWGGFLVYEVDFGGGFEEVIQCMTMYDKRLFVLFGDPVEGGAEGDDFAVGLEAGLEDGVGVVGVIAGELVVFELDVVDHAAADEGGFEMWDEGAFDDHAAEAGGVHFVGGEADGVGFGFVEEVGFVGHGLGGVDDDYPALFLDFFDDLGEVFEAAAVDVTDGVDDDEGVRKVGVFGDGAVGMAVDDVAGDVVLAGEFHGGEEGRVVLDVGGDDLVEAAGEGVKEQVDAVGGVLGEGDEVVAGFEAEVIEDFLAGLIN